MMLIITISVIVATLIVWVYNEVRNAPLMPDDYDQDITPRRRIAKDAEMHLCRNRSDFEVRGGLRPLKRSASAEASITSEG